METLTPPVLRPEGVLFVIPGELDLSDEELFRLCQVNHNLRLERTAAGHIYVMPPAAGFTGPRNARLTTQLGNWAQRDGTGLACDSSTGFRLPDGSMLSPDAAWIHRDRIAAIPEEDLERFWPLCPEFVVELRSRTDRLSGLQQKMEVWIANGAQLAWLLDPQTQTVHVYRPDAKPEVLEQAEHVSGDPLLPGFTLDLSSIWRRY